MEFSNQARAILRPLTKPLAITIHDSTSSGADYGGAVVACACTVGGSTTPNVMMMVANARAIVCMRQIRLRPYSSTLTRSNPPTADAAIAGLGLLCLVEAVLTMLQHASRNTRLSGAICLQRPTPRLRSTACASLRPTRLSPSHGSGTSLASSARSRRPTVRSSP